MICLVRKIYTILIVALCTFSMCAVAQAEEIKADTGKSALSAIESISSYGDDKNAELVIKLSAPATYTSYKTISPLRLVIDLSQVSPGKISAPVVINKSNIKRVTASKYDTDAGVLTRVEIELEKDIEAVLKVSPEKPGELRVTFPAMTVAIAEPDTKVAVDNKKVEDTVKPANTKLADNGSVENKQPQTDSSKVHVLKAITAENGKIVLNVEGENPAFKSFRLNKPERFVIDLLNAKSILPSRIVPLNSNGVSSARLGQYPDKLRVVFDPVGGAFPEVTAVQSEKGVNIVFTDTAKKTGYVAKAPLAAVPKEEESGKKLSNTSGSVVAKPVEKAVATQEVDNVVARVESIDFQVIEDITRISIKTTGLSDVFAPEATPGFVTLNLKRCVLPRQLQRSFESKAFQSPVLRVTPIQVRSRKGMDTKIRIAMRQSVPFEFKKEADMLYVDFKAVKTVSTIKRTKPNTEMNAKHQRSALDMELADSGPVVKTASDGKAYKGRRVTLEFADAEVRKIFQLLSEVSNKNFVLGDDVSGVISLKLVNVPWDQALDIILETKGLDKKEDGNIIIIKGKGKFKSQSEEDLELKKQRYKSVELVTETFSVNYAELKDVVTQFTAIKTDRGTVSPDERTNKIFVKDIPQAIAEMKSLLAQMDIPEKQVMIEARIVEATSTFVRTLGVSWGVHRNNEGNVNTVDSGFGGLTSLIPPLSGVNTVSGMATGITFGSIAKDVQVNLRLNAAATAGLIKIVSSPKVATLNNKTAKIAQGQQIPYQNTTATTGAVTQFVAATLSLEVTPHINANGTIGMKIIAKNDSPGTGSPPPINTKQATTELLMKDGETTVIGGIYVDNQNEQDDGVPFLMDIPIIGQLFKSNRKTITKTELLIFITPRLLTNV